MPVPDMKLGNSSAAMGVGVYFFILRLRVSGLEWASWNVSGSERCLECKLLCSGEHSVASCHL